MIYTTRYQSPSGRMLLAADGENLTGLWFEGQKYYAATLPADTCERSDLPVFIQTKKWLDCYFQGKAPAFDLPSAPCGSAFRQTVWNILRSIPYGKVTTYGEIARTIARRRGLKTVSAQAVGNAVGHNPVSIIIPCHRVIGSDGSLTGYAAGLDVKTRLLQLEGVLTTYGKELPFMLDFKLI